MTTMRDKIQSMAKLDPNLRAALRMRSTINAKLAEIEAGGGCKDCAKVRLYRLAEKCWNHDGETDGQ